MESRRSSYLYAAEAWRRFTRRMALGRINAMRFAGIVPDRLIVAPIDLRMADPHIAAEIYSGRFALGGTLLDTGGASPFLMEPPSRAFACSLYGFGWLRHMRAADHDLAFANARALVDDWITVNGRNLTGLSHDPDVLASRLISWFSHSPVVLRGADHGFYRRFLKSIVLQVRYLRHTAAVAPDGQTRLRVRIALAMASLCLPTSSSGVRAAARLLDAELDRQILPDGGHVSRNPMALIELLTELLPLRQTYVNLGQKLPSRMVPSMDRMYSALRFFRHTTGELALFNGASAVSADRLMAVLRYDETSGKPYREATQSQFQRLSSDDVVLLADTGPPGRGSLSCNAHAGCLSFEFSAGANRFIVNSGAPVFNQPEHAEFARLTAAHSTLAVNDTSSLRMSGSAYLGAIVIDGVRKVEVENIDQAGQFSGFSATHDGYVGLFGLLHRREIRLLSDGSQIIGRDQLLRPGERPIRPNDPSSAVIRFHVHPKIHVRHGGDGRIILSAMDGSRWAFASPDVEADIEEDIHFADLAGARASRLISLNFRPAQIPVVTWSFVREPAAG
ncbi:heparinase II/III family protein [Hoeflea marina]|nr:heparinase II/III family protein [Hoeflea marina]